MILVVGLSPAWQRTLEYDRFVVGKVNRARRVSETASGKGVNVARVAQQLGAKVRLLTVAGGHWGRLLKQSLREEGLNSRIINVRSETRICQTLLATVYGGGLRVNEACRLRPHHIESVPDRMLVRVEQSGRTCD